MIICMGETFKHKTVGQKFDDTPVVVVKDDLAMRRVRPQCCVDKSRERYVMHRWRDLARRLTLGPAYWRLQMACRWQRISEQTCNLAQSNSRRCILDTWRHQQRMHLHEQRMVAHQVLQARIEQEHEDARLGRKARRQGVQPHMFPRVLVEDIAEEIAVAHDSLMEPNTDTSSRKSRGKCRSQRHKAVKQRGLKTIARREVEQHSKG